MSKLQNQCLLRVLLVHPGTQHAPRLAETLEKRGLLWRFWTGFTRPRNEYGRRGARAKRGEGEGHTACGIRPKAEGKRVVDIPGERLKTIPWVEVLALVLARLPINREKLWHCRNWVFQKLVPKHEIEAVDVVVGFDTSAWVIGDRAKRAGKKFVLDQSVGHPLSRASAVRQAGGDEEMWPQAFDTRVEMLRKAEAIEHELADVVVAAGSFSKKTLVENGVPEWKIRLIPYGVGSEFLQAGAAKARGTEQGGAQSAHFESQHFHVLKEEEPTAIDSSPVTKTFRFLYAGYLTKRKGIGVLLEAWGKMGHEARNERLGELKLVGGGERPESLPAGVICLGQTPRDALVREMMEADVFVFPSLFEGFALVILEAMAAGLPVITTPNTAGPDLIENGKEGLIVPAGDSRGLREAMEYLLNYPEQARSMGCAAHSKAKRYTWERYGERWEAMLHELCS